MAQAPAKPRARSPGRTMAERLWREVERERRRAAFAGYDDELARLHAIGVIERRLNAARSIFMPAAIVERTRRNPKKSATFP